MAGKRIDKYVPQTKVPAYNGGWRMMVEMPLQKIVGYLSARHAAIMQETENDGGRAYLPYRWWVENYMNGSLTDGNFQSYRNAKKMMNYAWEWSEEFDRLNEQFLAEYDSREDLQEIYKDCVDGHSWVYERGGKYVDLSEGTTSPYKNRPETFLMFNSVVKRWGRSKIEMARETPYVEGDLVVLRDTAVDNSDADPLWVNKWGPAGRAGATTPDKSVQRIGTVMSVTGQLSKSWRPVKGSKVLKIMWFGTTDIVNVEERHVKFLERPSFKNGMKTRPAEE